MPITLGLRPIIKLEASGTVADVTRRIREAPTDYNVTVANQYILVKIPESRRHYWSPQLQIEIEEHESGTRLTELITPMPSVWTLFAMSYIAVLVLGVFGSIVGLAQLQLDQDAPWLWSLPAAALLIACIYGAAKIGQRIGRAQVEELTAFLRGCLN
ncbi:MAG: hypothetical protein ACI8W8_003634 [Rhodothermales bacterium]|jgi:hypothetical protein